MVKPPSEAVIVLFSIPVPLFLILTSAPGITPPDESTTVPDSEVKKLPCANAAPLAANVRPRAVSKLSRHDLIDGSLAKFGCRANS